MFKPIITTNALLFSIVLEKGDCCASGQADSCHDDKVMILQVGNSVLLCHCSILFPLLSIWTKMYCLNPIIINNDLLFSIVLRKMAIVSRVLFF